MGSNFHPALFLARVGVINLDKNYICRPNVFEFIEGIFNLCRKADLAGMEVGLTVLVQIRPTAVFFWVLKIRNQSFDVVPAELMTVLIAKNGVVRHPDREKLHSLLAAPQN
jgi:translation initiation factor 2B subunit (eIF-2B alpha/beta/delta family)